MKEVDEKTQIIPKEFSENGYKLFSELSNILHSDYPENNALEKYDSLKRLVIGILDNIKNNTEIISAMKQLGWKGNIDE